jgi:hypothetical protein
VKTVLIFGALCGVFSAQADVRMKVRVKSGDSLVQQTTVLSKAGRERIENGDGMVLIRQPDQRRVIVIDERARSYTVLQTEGTAPAAAVPPKKSGVVKVTSDVVDTGERRQFFGSTARRIRSVTVTDASEGACEPGKSRVETDGWYLDSAPEPDLVSPPGREAEEGCGDTYQITHKGTAKFGYPISYATEAWQVDNTEPTRTTYEVLELSSEPLAAALFDVPAGFTQSADPRELTAQAVAAAEPKSSSVRRVGVVAPDHMSPLLRASIGAPNIQTVALVDPRQAARAHCDYVLTAGDAAAAAATTPPRRKGMLGSLRRIAPVLDASGAPAVSYRLIRVSDGMEVLKGSEAGNSAGFVLRGALQLASSIEKNAVMVRALSGKYPGLRNLERVLLRIQAQAGAETPLSLYGGLWGYYATLASMQYAAELSNSSSGSDARALQPALEKLGHAVRAALAQ